LPPPPPSAAKTSKAIGRLKVAEPPSTSGYSRMKVPTGSVRGGGCDTRELVLIRDGRDVKTGTNIDHVAPLANAWRSGARNRLLATEG
jgi:hypothetical protein